MKTAKQRDGFLLGSDGIAHVSAYLYIFLLVKRLYGNTLYPVTTRQQRLSLR